MQERLEIIFATLMTESPLSRLNFCSKIEFAQIFSALLGSIEKKKKGIKRMVKCRCSMTHLADSLPFLSPTVHLFFLPDKPLEPKPEPGLTNNQPRGQHNTIVQSINQSGGIGKWDHRIKARISSRAPRRICCCTIS